MKQKIKEIIYAYYDDGTYYGYDVITEVSKKKGQYAWTNSGDEFYESAIDFLNRNYLNLAGGDLIIDGESQTEFYRKINKLLADIGRAPFKPFKEEEIELVIQGLEDIEKTAIREMVDYVLLASNDTIRGKCAQRYFAYCKTHFKASRKLLDYHAKSHVEPLIPENEQTKHLYSSEGSNDFFKLYNDEEKESFASICNNLFENKYPVYMVTSKVFNNFSDMMRFIFTEMIRLDIRVKKCRNCNKYFVPNRLDSMYCGEASPQDKNKTCKEYGKYANFLEKSRNDEATRLYKQLYNAMNNKVRRCKTPENPGGNKNFESSLKKFIAEASLFRKAIKNKVKTQDEYVQWLKKCKLEQNE